MKTITPSKGMHLYNEQDGTVYEGAIYVPDTFDKTILSEITEEEYQAIIEKQLEPLSARLEKRLSAVEEKAEFTAVAVEEVIELVVGGE